MKTIAANIAVWNDTPGMLRLVSLLRPFVDEIVIVHDGPCSNSGLKQARKLGADVVFVLKERTGMPEDAKRVALALSESDWVFCLDTDEAVTPELLVDLHKIIDEHPDALTFNIRLHNFYAGKFWSENWPNRLSRVTTDMQLPSMLHVGYNFSGSESFVGYKLEQEQYRIDHNPDPQSYAKEKNARYNRINLHLLDKFSDAPLLINHILDCVGGNQNIREELQKRGYYFDEESKRYIPPEKPIHPARTLAAQVIVHNEAERLSSLLPQLHRFHELVIVSDGVPDRATKAIAREKGAKLFQTRQEYHHAAPARRLGISLTKSDWFFVIDPDEEPSEALLDSLEALIAKPHCCAYKVPVHHYLDDILIRTDFQLRLVRLTPFVQWSPLPHSGPEALGLSGLEIHYCAENLFIDHRHTSDYIEGSHARFSTVVNNLMGHYNDLPRARGHLIDCASHYAASREYFLQQGWVEAWPESS